MSSRRVSFDDRRLAEAVRYLEPHGAPPMTDGPVAAGARPDDSPEAMISSRAGRVPDAADLRVAMSQVDQALRWVGAAVLVAALIAGAAAAASALGTPPLADGSGRRLNLIELMLAVLGVQTLFLGLWIGLTVARPRMGATSPLLWVPRAMLRRLAALGRRNPEAPDGRSRLAAAARATASPLAAPGLARATASVLAHGTWTAFNVGALLAMVILMTSREYRFTWETTLLEPQTGERIVRTMLAAPMVIGVPGPDDAAIQRAQPESAGAQAPEDRRTWAIATLGMVAVYGLAPRLVLGAVALGVRRHRRRRWRLDLEQPYYQELLARLRARTRVRTEEPDDPRPLATDPEGAWADGDGGGSEDGDDDGATYGGPVLLRLETERPATWPPAVRGVDWNDLGPVDGRADEHRVLEQITGLSPAPARVVAVADLALTPDRGHERLLAAVRHAAGRPLRLVLTGGQAARQRRGADAVAARGSAWRALGERLGLADGHVLEVDLDHATGASLDRLDALLGLAGTVAGGRTEPGDAATVGASHLDSSLDLVVDAVAEWRTVPDAAQQAELHRAIHRRYRVDPGHFAGGPGFGERAGQAAEGVREAARRLHDADPAMLGASMRTAAAEMLDRLPPGLRASPRWAAAGAIAGACGCLAAAAAITPLAVTALPAWAGGGAVIAAVLRSVRQEARGADAAADAVADPAGDAARVGADTGAAADAAILLTLVLELQGRNEAVISRVLEITLGGISADGSSAPQIPGDRPSARARTEDVRERFDAAMAAEVAP